MIQILNNPPGTFQRGIESPSLVLKASARNPRLYRAADALRRNTEAHQSESVTSAARAELANAKMILQACGIASLEEFYDAVKSATNGTTENKLA